MKKIILLALAAISAAIFVLPATAMAITPLHVVPKPESAKTVHGVGSATLTGPQDITCVSHSGTATFSTTTTGTFQQTFKECKAGIRRCTTSGQAVGTIKTNVLPFELGTVEDSITHAGGPGILVTPGPGGFASFTCEGEFPTTVAGNGLIGTITKPACGSSSKEATIEFSSSSHSVQTHKTVVGTATEYYLQAFGAFQASEDAHGTITLGTEAKLECT
jgi:hypothetical protein